MKADEEKISNTIVEALKYTKDAVMIVTLDEELLYYNKAWVEVHGFDPAEDYTGRKLRDLERAQLHPLIDEAKKELYREGFHSVQFESIRRDGKYQIIHIVATLVEHLDPPRIVVVIREITQLFKAKKELEQRNRELSVINEVNGIINSLEDPEITLERALETIMDYCGSHIAVLYRIDRNKREARMISSKNVPAEIMKESEIIELSDDRVKMVLEKGEVVIIDGKMQAYTSSSIDFRKKQGIRRTLVLPFSFHGRVKFISVLACREEKNSTPELRNFLEILVGQLGIALERLDLLNSLETKKNELKNLTARLIGANEEERRKIARTLHDETGQSLMAIKVQLDLLEKQLRKNNMAFDEPLEIIKEQLRHITDSVKQIAYSLHPSMLEDLGIVPSLRCYVDRFIASENLQVKIEAAGFNGRLRPQLLLALYRIAQEALTNVVRHADASHVTVKLTKGFPKVRMCIEDDGRGFSLGGLMRGEARGRGLGIIGMRERVEHLGGSFRIRSLPGKGTSIHVILPLEIEDGRKD